MRVLLFLTIIISTKIFALDFSPSESELADLEEYRALLIDLQTVDQQIIEFEKHPCIIQSLESDDCSIVYQALEDLLNDYFEISTLIEELKVIILPYLDENDQILYSVEKLLEDPFLLTQTCPTSPIDNLLDQTDSMLIFANRLREIGVYENFMDVTNAQKRDCSETISNDCWQVDQYGNVFYITKHDIKIEASCFLDNQEAPRLKQYSPDKIIAAANSAVSKMKTCYSKLNPVIAKQIISRINKQEFMMFCNPPDSDPNNQRCGFKNISEDYFHLVLTEKGCDGYDETIFHEMLHMAPGADNLSTLGHGYGACAKYDSVYFCSRYCFPRSKRDKIYFTEKACSGCIKDPEEAKVCQSPTYDTSSYDDSFFQCY